jgi:hypothetical protein
VTMWQTIRPDLYPVLFASLLHCALHKVWPRRFAALCLARLRFCSARRWGFEIKGRIGATAPAVMVRRARRISGSECSISESRRVRQISTLLQEPGECFFSLVAADPSARGRHPSHHCATPRGSRPARYRRETSAPSTIPAAIGQRPSQAGRNAARRSRI